MTNIRMIFWSRWMVAGVICEILAFIAAVGNWFAGSWLVWQLLPNVALTLATLGAIMVAGRVAWDYHGRGLNGRQQDNVRDILASASLSARQREEAEGILANANLNETQKEEVAEAIKSSGLTERQKSELEAAIKDVHIFDTVLAQKAMAEALSYVWERGPNLDFRHGHVVVIDRTRTGQLEVQRVESPLPQGICERQHEDELTPDINTLEIAKSLFQSLGTPVVLWMHPGNGKLCYTNFHNRMALGRGLVFNLYNCVPEWRASAPGDDVLTRDESGKWAWVQRS